MICIIILGGSLLRSFGIGIHKIYWTQEYLGGDLATHFLMGALLMFAGLLLISDNKKSHVSCWLVVSLILILEESSQLFIDSRSFRIADLALGLFGALATFLVTLPHLKWNKIDKDSPSNPA